VCVTVIVSVLSESRVVQGPGWTQDTEAVPRMFISRPMHAWMVPLAIH